MLISCWSVKGGSGTTVVAVSLALVLARAHRSGALVADLGGDVPPALGAAHPGSPGIVGWLGAGPEVPADALARLELDAGHGLALLPRGTGPLSPVERLEVLAGVLAADERPVVVDCGLIGPGAAGNGDEGGGPAAVAAVATHSLLVIRPCYLALRRVAAAPIRPSGVVLVVEHGRALGRADVEHVVGAPVVAEVAVDPGVARAVDAGLLATRFPRTIDRALGRVAGALPPSRVA